MGVLPDWMVESQVKIAPMAKCETRPGKISYGTTSYGYDARTGYRFQVFAPNPKAAVVVDPKDFDVRALVDVDLTPVDVFGLPLSDAAGEVMDRQRVVEFYQDGGRTPPADHIVIPPHSFALAETVEHIEVPRDVLCVVVGKSTYARCGIIVPLTPLEPEWRGKVTVEIGNTTGLPAKVYAGEGIMQLLFFRSDGVCLSALAEVADWMKDQDSRTEEVGLSDCLLRLRKILNRESTVGTCQLSYADKKGIYQDQGGIVHPSIRRLSDGGGGRPST